MKENMKDIKDLKNEIKEIKREKKKSRKQKQKDNHFTICQTISIIFMAIVISLLCIFILFPVIKDNNQKIDVLIPIILEFIKAYILPFLNTVLLIGIYCRLKYKNAIYKTINEDKKDIPINEDKNNNNDNKIHNKNKQSTSKKRPN